MSGIIPGRKEEDKSRQAVFLTPLNPFGKDAEEEKPHSDYTVPRKAPYETKWTSNQNAVYWAGLKEAQDQGFEFWQTTSFAIMTYFTIPGDCIDRVTPQDGDRELFETACDTKAHTQGHVEAELAKPAAATAAASAAAHFTHRRTQYLETESNMGKQGRSARRLETHRRSGPSHQETGAYHF